VLAAGLVAVLFSGLVAACSSHSKPTPAHTSVPVAVFGDSLTVQATDALRAQGHAQGLDVSVVGYYGLAPCDLASLARKAIARRPRALVLAFSGNNITPCMSRDGHKLVGPAFFAAYRADIGALVADAIATKVPVLVVGTLTFPPGLDDPDRVELNAVYRELVAAHPGAHYVATAPALGAHGYVTTLPCLPGETAALGCHDGTITVRGPSRIHFDELRAVPCPHASGKCYYSAGAHRFATAILGGLAKIAGLPHDTVPAAVGVPVDSSKDF
jgi:hypothetical protein